MKIVSHSSAKPSHYDSAALHYDKFNESNSKQINQLLETFLLQYKVNRILDLTCGTGSQVFWLTQAGFDVVGVDLNANMLSQAMRKAEEKNLKIPFHQGDMRATQVGKFDAVITIFNAIGHLTQSDFEQAIRNVHKNLNAQGLYIFDIFNLNYLLEADNITKLTIDWQETKADVVVRDIQYSTINQAGVLASYTTHYEQEGMGEVTVSQSAQTLQVYTAQQLTEMLQANGFKVLQQCDTNGSPFNETKTERVLTIAQKA